MTYDFFDADVMADEFRDTMLELSPYFTSGSEAAKKYKDDLFMLAPFYHR